MAMANGLRVALMGLAGLGLFSGIVLATSPRPSEPSKGAVVLGSEAPDVASVAASSDDGPAMSSFDTVRLEPDGTGIVAGRAEPGATVAIMDGEEVAAQAVADADGRFVAFLALPPSPEPRVLSLVSGEDGVASDETVILAPIAGPVDPGPVDPAAGVDTAALGEAPPAAPSGQAPAEAPGPAALPLPADDAAEPSAGLALVADGDGVRVLAPAVADGTDPATLAAVALDAISYDGAGEVTLSGRGREGGIVRLYVDNDLAAEVPVDPDGRWETALTATPPGVYTLRVDEVDVGGAVVSRIETPFQREERQAIALAMSEVQEAAMASSSLGAPPRPGAVVARTVLPGNTLWAIARERYGEPMMYVRVFEMNRDRIRDADLIYPGQVVVLPATDGR